MMAVMIPVKPLSDEHDEEEQVAEEADKDEQAVEHQDGRQARRVPDIFEFGNVKEFHIFTHCMQFHNKC